MKIGIFTDIHLNKFSAFSGTDGRRRLMDGINVLNKAFELFIKKRCNAVIFIGDLFHTRRNIDVDVFNTTCNALSALPLHKIPAKFIVPGNHDWYDIDCTTHSAEFLKQFGFQVVNKYETAGFLAIEEAPLLHLLPWVPSKKLPRILARIVKGTKKGRHLLFLHATPHGSSSATGFVFKNEIDLTKYSKHFEYIFCGDIHKQQFIGDNIIICGSPMQHNFGDSGQTRGVYIYDSKKGDTKYYPMDKHYPKFRLVESMDDVNDYDYHRIIGTGVAGANVEVVSAASIDKGTTVNTNWVPEKIVEKYAKKHGKGFDISKLVQIGKDAIQ